MPTRIGVFGGSFDPPHLGHLIAAQAAAEQLGLDLVLWVPTGATSHKGSSTAVGHRVAMTELAIAGNDRFQISQVDAERNRPTYTYDTLNELRALHPAAELVWILGDDSWETIDSWHRSSEVRVLAQFAVVRRDSSESRSDEGSLRWVDIPSIGISSTECRLRIARGQSVRYWVPDAVAHYIASNSLYSEDA